MKKTLLLLLGVMLGNYNVIAQTSPEKNDSDSSSTKKELLYGVFPKEKLPQLKNFSISGYYRFITNIRNLSDPYPELKSNPKNIFVGLMDREVVDLLNQMPERNRYIRGLRSWVGFNQTAIKFERDLRFAGEVKYTFTKSFALAVNGLVSFSSIPLRLSTYLGLFSAFLAIVMAILVLYWRVFTPHSNLTGFATIAIAIFFLGAVQLISIGILGEYIGRIYEEVKGRPLYTLAEVGRRNLKLKG